MCFVGLAVVEGHLLGCRVRNVSSNWSYFLNCPLNKEFSKAAKVHFVTAPFCQKTFDRRASSLKSSRFLFFDDIQQLFEPIENEVFDKLVRTT